MAIISGFWISADLKQNAHHRRINLFGSPQQRCLTAAIFDLETSAFFEEQLLDYFRGPPSLLFLSFVQFAEAQGSLADPEK